jgi:hypothetical protein
MQNCYHFFRISRLHTEMTTDGTKDTTQEPQGIFSSNFYWRTSESYLMNLKVLEAYSRSFQATSFHTHVNLVWINGFARRLQYMQGLVYFPPRKLQIIRTRKTQTHLKKGSLMLKISSAVNWFEKSSKFNLFDRQRSFDCHTVEHSKRLRTVSGKILQSSRRSLQRWRNELAGRR